MKRVHISLKGYKEVRIMHAKRGSATDHEYIYLYRASLDKNRRKDYVISITFIKGHLVNCLTAG